MLHAAPPPPPPPPPHPAGRRSPTPGVARSRGPPGSGGVARRAADAITNLAHENVDIKHLVRQEGGIPPLVALLEAADLKVRTRAGEWLRGAWRAGGGLLWRARVCGGGGGGGGRTAGQARQVAHAPHQEQSGSLCAGCAGCKGSRAGSCALPHGWSADGAWAPPR